MHDLKDIVQNPQKYKDAYVKRNFDHSTIDNLVRLDDERKKLIRLVEDNRAKLNQLAKEIGEAKKSNQDASELISSVQETKSINKESEERLEHIKLELEKINLSIPNLLAGDVPEGDSEDSNEELFKKGTIPSFDFTPKDHVALGENLGGVDFEQATKVSGSRFVFLKNEIAKLERSLINFMLDEHSKAGYEEIIPPFIVHERSLVGTGQLPKFKDDLFKIESTDLYLIPTAEVPLTNILREQTFPMSQLPLKLCAYTPCFRSEAGSYGKDTRGLIRLHQFNKVELVNIVAPQEAAQAHEDMIKRACTILDLLELPYRAVVLCSGDIGFGAIKTIDLEVWLPSQNCYREISSISNCGDFQSRRAHMRYKNAQGEMVYPYTLNGSGLAVGRTLVAILENYQQVDGSIEIPAVLRPYMKNSERICAKPL